MSAPGGVGGGQSRLSSRAERGHKEKERENFHYRLPFSLCSIGEKKDVEMVPKGQGYAELCIERRKKPSTSRSCTV